MRKKLRNTRPKALFGEAAAIIAAAGIQAAATTAGAGIQARAAAKAAESQGKATVQAARQNSQALLQQNENNIDLQQKSQDFTKSQNEENRQLQRDIQMNLQLLTGGQTENDRREASKIQVKNGGKVEGRKHKYRLWGDNIDFRVKDGGGVIPLGFTPEGFDLYELYGNDHEHYHKTQGGKNETGVGIEFANGKIIEGEGNQNSNNGELLLTTPNDAFFISKHNIAGFNPAKAVKQGMHPLMAANIQEQLKDEYNISDDGKAKKGKRVRKLRLAGGNLDPYINNDFGIVPDLSTDITAPAAVGVAYATQQNRNEFRNGGRLKADFGTWLGKNNGLNGNLLGAGITSLGNIGGALIGMWGNNRAAGILNKAYTQAGDIMADAYRRMKTIDLSTLNRDDFRAAHYMPVLQSTYFNANPQLESVNRDLARRTDAINRNTASSAAQLNRLGTAISTADEQRSKIYANKYNEEAKRGASNMEALNEAAAKNAELDTQANRDFANNYLQLLQYNNDITNQAIMGEADAKASALTNSASANATAKTANASAWGSALTSIGSAFGNTMSAYVKAKQDRQNTLLGANTTTRVQDAMQNNDVETMRDFYNMFKDSKDPYYKGLAEQLAKKLGIRTDVFISSTDIDKPTINIPSVPRTITINR